MEHEQGKHRMLRACSAGYMRWHAWLGRAVYHGCHACVRPKKRQKCKHIGAFAAAVTVLEFAQPTKNKSVSETERWGKLSAKAWAFRKTLDEHLAAWGDECNCATLVMAPLYETVALTLPKEVLSLARKREKAGKLVEFKPVAQVKLSAREMTLKLRIIFSWINEALENFSGAEAKIDFKHVVRIQFFYKYVLRIINHWNFCHATTGGGVSLPMQRNLMQTLNDQSNKTLLGVILNELDFLRMHLGFEANAAAATSAASGPQRSLSGSLPSLGPARSRGSGAQVAASSVPSSLALSPLSRTLSGSAFALSLSNNAVAIPPLSMRGSRESSARSSPHTSPPMSPTGPISPGARATHTPTGAFIPLGQMSPIESPASTPRLHSSAPKVSPDTSPRNDGPSLVKSGDAPDRHHLLAAVEGNPELRERFLRFAREKFAEENVDFLLEVRRIFKLEQAQRAPALRRLHAVFLTSDSDKEVNLSARARRAALQGLEAAALETVDLSCLDFAIKEVETQVVTNLVDPFLKMYPAALSSSSSSSSSVSPGSTPLPLSPPPATSAFRVVELAPSQDDSLEEVISIRVLAASAARVKRRTTIVSGAPFEPAALKIGGQRDRISRQSSSGSGTGALVEAATLAESPPPMLSPPRSNPTSPGRGGISAAIVDAGPLELRRDAAAFAAAANLTSHIALYATLSEWLAADASKRATLVPLLQPRLPESADLPESMRLALAGPPGEAGFAEAVQSAHAWLQDKLERELYEPFLQRHFTDVARAVDANAQEAALDDLKRNASAPVSGLPNLRGRLVASKPHSLSFEDLLSLTQPSRASESSMPRGGGGGGVGE